MFSTHKYAIVAGILLGATALTTPALASHFRGGAMVPSVSASGLLTVDFTSFWRPGANNFITPTVDGLGFMTSGVGSTDTSDVRFEKNTQLHTIQLPGAGTYNITGTSCCRVEGIQNWQPGSSSVSWTLNSTIVWNGTTANTPILFDFSAVQPEVVRGSTYSDSLGAVSGNAGTLSYDQVLNTIPAQPPGFTVNAATGALNIPAANTATYLDNTAGNDGADYAFSGNITNTDGSSVEFDWLFDAVNTTGNLAPDVNDYLINATIGDLINQLVSAMDANVLDDVTLSLLSFFGPGANFAPSFVAGAPGNPTTGTFSWNTAGSLAGVYIANITGTDGSLTDVGTITINLSRNGVQIPEPGTLAMLIAGLLGLGVAVRRRRKT